MNVDDLVREGIDYLKKNIFGQMPPYMQQFDADMVGGTVLTRFSVTLDGETRYLERQEFYTVYPPDMFTAVRIIDVYEVRRKHVLIHTEYERF